MHVWLSKCFESSLVVLTILDSTIVSPTRRLGEKRHGEIKQEVWGGENNIRLVAQWHPSLVFLGELTLVCNYRRPMQWPAVFAPWAALRAQEILLSRHKRLPRLDLRDNGEVGKKNPPTLNQHTPTFLNRCTLPNRYALAHTREQRPFFHFILNAAPCYYLDMMHYYFDISKVVITVMSASTIRS